MVIRLLTAAVWLTAALWATALDEAKGMLSARSVAGHQRLLALLFSRDADFRTAGGYDVGKIAGVLKENGLLRTALPTEREVRVSFQSGEDESPTLFLKVVGGALLQTGVPAPLTRGARFDGSVYRWDIAYKSASLPDPQALQKALRRYGARLARARLTQEGDWFFLIKTDRAFLPVARLRAGQSRRVLRPLRPIWFDVSAIKSVTFRENPGSHWYPSVTVYDKMLNVLSVKRPRQRTRYLRLRLPRTARYVKVTDRFSIENLRYGLRVDAGSAR